MKRTPPVAIKVGQVWRDRDPRMRDRHCMVFEVPTDGKPHLCSCRPDGSNPQRYDSTRVSVDGLRKRWRLVKDAQ